LLQNDELIVDVENIPCTIVIGREFTEKKEIQMIRITTTAVAALLCCTAQNYA